MNNMLNQKTQTSNPHLDNLISFDSDLDSKWYLEQMNKNIFWYEKKPHEEIFNLYKKYSKFSEAQHSIYVDFTDNFSNNFIDAIKKLEPPCYLIYQDLSLLIKSKDILLDFMKNYRFGLTEFFLIDKNNKSRSINHELLFYKNFD